MSPPTPAKIPPEFRVLIQQKEAWKGLVFLSVAILQPSVPRVPSSTSPPASQPSHNSAQFSQNSWGHPRQAKWVRVLPLKARG